MLYSLIAGTNFMGLGPEIPIITIAALLAFSIGIPQIREMKYRDTALLFVMIWGMLLMSGFANLVNIIIYSITTILISIYFILGRAE